MEKILILQILPKTNDDVDGLDRLFSDSLKANIINTLGTMPYTFIDCISNIDNLFVINCNSDLISFDNEEEVPENVTAFYMIDTSPIASGTITVLGDHILSLNLPTNADSHSIIHEFWNANEIPGE